MKHSKEIEDALFYAAVSMTDAEQRRDFLDQSCHGNQELRRAVEELLSAHDEADGFFSKGRAALELAAGEMKALLPDMEQDKPVMVDEFIGTRIGRYKLLERIGEGGCGVVYMAEQQEPVRRRVALKVIKLGMDTKLVMARFDAERQALAMMDHPNIARVLDAGATETGRPYFVMELVRGFKLTEYCDQNNLDTRGRLDLFIQVCHAVQHAHQKGIVHRDIKPSNILVTLHDGRPVPKVIDFGIAKAMEGKLTDQTLFTAYEQLIGTPAYMSPEQAEMSGLDVDTRSDIYSLGVLLYELLTGRTPFDQKELIRSGVDEMRRKLREVEPPRPSTVLTTLHEPELRVAAAQRHTEAPGLISLLKGDLDWVVMKALEKDRRRRYETANGLAMDVERYLNNEPVLARPPSRTYLFKKLVRRHQVAFLSSSAVAVALVVGLGAATWMYFRERAAHQEQARLREQAEAAERRESELRQQAEAKEQINQAAIYVSQNKLEEANEILGQVKILPKQPSFDGVVAYRRVGEWLALQQRWNVAAERYGVLMEIDKLDAWQVVTLDYQACGVLLAECGNQDRYNAFCKAAIARFRRSNNGDMLGRILKTCLLFPPDKGLMQQLKPMAEVTDSFYSPISPERFPPWPALYLALWEYRLGNFSGATIWCARGIERSARIPALKATLQVISAMASHQQGQSDRAEQELAGARELVDAHFQTGFQSSEQQGVWYDWLFARVLLKEATILIEGREEAAATGAVQEVGK